MWEPLQYDHTLDTRCLFNTIYFYLTQKNVGRVMGNEAEVVQVLKKGNLMDLQVVDTAKMSYYDQLKVRF